MTELVTQIVGVGDLAPVHIIAAVFSSDRLAQQKNTMLTNQVHFHKLLESCGVQVDEALDRMATLAKLVAFLVDF